MTEPKSGRELQGERGHKGPEIVRRFYRFFGIDTGASETDEL